MKPIKYEFHYNDRKFICLVKDDPAFNGRRARVKVYEEKKFLCFNKVCLDSRGFWVTDFRSIEDGAKAVLADCLRIEEERKEISKKWEKALDNR